MVMDIERLFAHVVPGLEGIVEQDEMVTG